MQSVRWTRATLSIPMLCDIPRSPLQIFPPGNKPGPEDCDFPATLVSTRRHGGDVRAHRNTFSGERNTAQVVPAPAMRPDFSREYRAKAILHRETLVRCHAYVPIIPSNRMAIAAIAVLISHENRLRF